MFFSDDLLTSKKGSLMATLGPRNKKITRKQLTAVDLAKTCDLIAMPPEPLALRLSGALLVGVARVYHQNYDIFHSDVSAFHATLRRSTTIDLKDVSTGVREQGGIDLPGSGTSRHDHITLGGVHFDWGAGFFGQDFRDIDWENPLNVGRKRRASSVLSSQAMPLSQDRGHLGQDDDGLEIGSEKDYEDLQLGRDNKRKKSSASPALGANFIPYSIDRAGHLPSDPSASGLYGLNVPFGEEVDLGLNLDYDEPAGLNDSFSGPSGRQLEVPFPQDMGDAFCMDGDAPMMVADDEDYPVLSPQGNTNRNALGDNQRPGSREDSLENIETVLDLRKKTKTARKVNFDKEIELDRDEDQKARQWYAQSMSQERNALRTKEEENACILQANVLVNSAGGLEFFNTDMTAFISAAFQVDKFEWESDLAVRRQRQQGIAASQNEDEDGDGRNQRSNGHDVFGPLIEDNAAVTFPEEDYMPMVFDEHEPERHGSEASALDIEYARHMSVQSQGLPWEAYLTPGFNDAGDTSFSPSSLKLSVMTPQEQCLRLNNRLNSTSGHHQQRVRSSSLISDRPDNDPLILTTGKDISLDLSYDLDTFTSPHPQNDKLSTLPRAFSPAMLATLEKQCREFFIYLEKQMVNMHTDELVFGDIIPKQNLRRVAAIAFYDCLTLATKEILAINQPHPWGHVHMKFSVSV